MTPVKYLRFNRAMAVVLFSGLFTPSLIPAVAQEAVPEPNGSANTSSKIAFDVHGHVPLDEVDATKTLRIVVGHSMMLRGTNPLGRVYIGNPAVLQSFTAGPREILLTAKVPGTSSLGVWDTRGQSSLYTVAADVDPEALSQSLAQIYPTSHITVEGREDRIYLTGSVPTQDVADGAAKLAVSYGKDIVNSLRVVPVHAKQVELKLQILEVDRTKMEQYGVNVFGTGKNPFSTTTGQFSSSISSNSGATGSSTGVIWSSPLNLNLFSQALNVGATIEDLEQKQILQILAEPTLTTLSGEPAKFLSGGELPYPVLQGAAAAGAVSAVSIAFRPYGVNVEFTPVVNADGSIRLRVAPEVSTLDYSNAVTVSGFTVPALSTRRAETEVEIHSGQTFAVSGLLDHRTTESLSQIPGISSVPILGKLFVSKAYNHSVVELVVLVTATVVNPLTGQAAPVEPTFAVPNITAKTFDNQLSKEQRIPPKQP